MLDFKSILGEDYNDGLTMSELTEKLQSKGVNLVAWDDDKYTTKAEYIKVEKQALDEKSKRKELAGELEKFKQANMSAEDRAKAETQALKDEIANLKLEKTKSDMRSMYKSLGYSDQLSNELVDVDFYDGADKLTKKNDILRRAKDELLSGYKNTILNNDTVPSTNPTSTLSKKAQYKAEYDKAIQSGRSEEIASILTRAYEENIDILN